MAKKSDKRSTKITKPHHNSPKSQPTPAAKTSKSAAIIALLRRQGGASLDEMMSATGWQKHSVRGFIAGALKKQHGLVASSESTDTGRVYRIAAPAQQ